MDLLTHAQDAPQDLNRGHGKMRPRLQGKTYLKLAIALFAISTIGACLLIPTQTPHFSHKVHTIEESLTCVYCHDSVESSDTAGMPGSALCYPCHDDIDAKKPEDRRLPAYYDDQHRYIAGTVASVSDEIKFSHASHTKTHGVKCEDCHGDVGQTDTIPAASAVTKSECITCHADQGKRTDCDSCHTTIGRDWQPPNHAFNWDVQHGQIVRSGDNSNLNKCSLCHSQPSECKSCHDHEAPRDHTNFWRTRAHGVAVAIDRDRCSTCHRRDSCDSCHQATRPVNHLAGYGGSTARHCVGCHMPLSTTGCATCHKQTTGHLLATPIPVGHSPTSNCRQCHGVTAPMPHPDGGHACMSCH